MHSYLKSTIVELVVGAGDNEAILSAHESILVKSPWFAEKCAQFRSGGPVCPLVIVIVSGG
jgi:hypothetical protein